MCKVPSMGKICFEDLKEVLKLNKKSGNIKADKEDEARSCRVFEGMVRNLELDFYSKHSGKSKRGKFHILLRSLRSLYRDWTGGGQECQQGKQDAVEMR